MGDGHYCGEVGGELGEVTGKKGSKVCASFAGRGERGGEREGR